MSRNREAPASSLVLAFALVAGAMSFILGAPGGPFPRVGWLAPIPFIALGRRGSLLYRIVGSAVLAASATGPIVAGVAFRAPLHGIALALFPSCWLAAAIFVACQSRAISPPSRVLLFASVWTGGSSMLELLGVPLQGWCLSAALALEHPWIWPVIELGGWPLLDALLFAGFAVSMAFVQTPRSPRVLLGAGGAGAVVLIAMCGTAWPRVTGTTRLGLVQPNTTWASLRNTGTSPADRSQVKRRVLALTRQALASGAELVVWPENGMGMPLGQRPSELERLQAMSIENSAHILATGDEMHPNGARPAAWMVSSDGVSVAAKRESIPLLEDSVGNEAPTVLPTAGTRVGLLMCYDVIRYRSFRHAVLGGAELVVSPTDNASYTSSTLTDFQLAFGALMAIEHGRSLVFVVNRGPSTLVDPRGGRIETLLSFGRAGVSTIDMEQTIHETRAVRGGRILTTAVLIGSALFLLLWPTRSNRGCAKRRSRPHLMYAFASAVAWTAATWVSAEASMRLAMQPSSTVDALRHYVASSRVRRVFDPGSQVFRQSEENGCGPAALAWVTFALGDTGFERDFARHEGPHSLADLERSALDRGFRARVFQGTPEGLRAAADTSYVLHLEGDHFVGCLARADGTYTVFDPADGEMSSMEADVLAARWSGYGLEVKLPKPLSNVERAPGG